MNKKQYKRLNQLYMEQEAVIEGFAEAMRKANINYMAAYGTFTGNMDLYWNRYLGICMALALLKKD